jgi:hypothetical protein
MLSSHDLVFRMLSNKFDPIVEIVDPNQTFPGGIVVSKFVFSGGGGGGHRINHFGRRWSYDKFPVCRVSLLRNGKEAVSVGEEVDVENSNTANYAGSSIVLELEKVRNIIPENPCISPLLECDITLRCP